MIPLPTARRRAEEFDAAVSAPAGGPSAGSPSTRPDGELLALVAALREEAGSAPAPRTDFVDDLRSRLMAEADTVLVPITADDEQRLRLQERAPSATRRQRRVAAVAAAVVISGASTTMAYAAQDALPGDPLYGVKRTLEGARGSISLTDASKGQVTLRHAEQRLAEVQGLVARDDSASAAQVSDALTTFSEQAEEAGDLLLAAAVSDGSDRPATALRDFVRRSVATLDEIEPDLAGRDRDALGRAVSTLSSLDGRALDVCPTCGSSAVLDLPAALAATEDLFLLGMGTDVPELPALDEASDLPPGSVTGNGSVAQPGASPETTAPDPGAGSGGSNSSTGGGTTDGGGTSPSQSGSTPSTVVPPVPGVTAPSQPPNGNGGLSDVTEGVTGGSTGPLSDTLNGVTEALDSLLGLNKRG
ncbi:DUF5667 domain-containing protein [Nocardioides zeae]|uniref:DUF5667 domain-containing protein n=1 Tax=Nocardioides imazamoxiresistens TaxID=3231893 RepID=A0ABU3PZW6_9ACTN|nr:DUF5667 domain-containing protein [Nocardioides zeae]MDT9594797.1 DUF5667 domain-containing protein [Nocardioides zeae]